MFNGNQRPWAVHNTTSCIADTPEFSTELSPFYSTSEPTSPTQRLSLQPLALSSPQTRAINSNLVNSIHVIDWSPSSGTAGTTLTLRISLPKVDPSCSIAAKIFLESRFTPETIPIASQVNFAKFEANSGQQSASVTCTVPQFRNGHGSDVVVTPHPFIVKLSLDFHEHPNLSCHMIHVGEYTYLEPDELVYPRESVSTKSLSVPSSFSLHPPSRHTELELSGTNDPGFQECPWTSRLIENRHARSCLQSDAMEFHEAGVVKSPSELSHIYPLAPANHEFRSHILALKGASPVGRTARSKSHSDSRPMRLHEFEYPNLNSKSRVESRLIMKLEGSLSDMMRGWTNEELRSGRRLVQFERKLSGSLLTICFKAVPSHTSEPDNRSSVVSCIYRDNPDGCYITSVDTISLIESLVGTNFPTAEKNRIRRNLQGFKPFTVTKSKPDFEVFFKRIMSFQNPKPRNIEKDIKVFPWGILEFALAKIVGKYTCICDGPDDPNAIINFDFHSPNRDSLKYRPEARAPYRLISSKQESPLAHYDTSMLSSARPTRSHSSSALDYSQALSSQNGWLGGLRVEENPALSVALPIPTGKQFELSSPLPWRLKAQSDSPSSSSSFETTNTFADRTETGMLSLPFIPGCATNSHTDIERRILYPLHSQNSDGMLQD
ncbi:hypothetical protein CROQUDRAFT_42242 [Cronartium quercuum f. sp. fusiforme G11]|uniref:DUF7082 domain-containing protein n=1 Tax=Cronartium quercuum f. sp. fusiforme G11 TaxID=708437 RepID=A0A9P6NJ05_9BASI|nr:hypothetical protein CROQUDRAFT_42242 [Cronartium quercuum f. sp. fusiforme G11]